MSKIAIALPPQAITTGALYDKSNRFNLDEDMLQICLPGDVVIDIGWQPDWDPRGNYVLIVFQGDVDNPLEQPFTTNDCKKAVAQIHDMVGKYLSLTPFDTSANVDTDTPITMMTNGQMFIGPHIVTFGSHTDTEFKKVVSA